MCSLLVFYILANLFLLRIQGGKYYYVSFTEEETELKSG